MGGLPAVELAAVGELYCRRYRQTRGDPFNARIEMPTTMLATVAARTVRRCTERRADLARGGSSWRISRLDMDDTRQRARVQPRPASARPRSH